MKRCFKVVGDVEVCSAGTVVLKLDIGGTQKHAKPDEERVAMQPPQPTQVVSDMLAGRLVCSPSKAALSASQISSHVIYLQRKHCLESGTRNGQWNTVVHELFLKWLREEKHQRRAQPLAIMNGSITEDIDQCNPAVSEASKDAVLPERNDDDLPVEALTNITQEVSKPQPTNKPPNRQTTN